MNRFAGEKFLRDAVAALVQLRDFAGLTIADAAQRLNLRRHTADRPWAAARAGRRREPSGSRAEAFQESAAIFGAPCQVAAH